MRIALVCHELAPFHGSGIGVYAAEAANAWLAAGHELHLITADHPGVAQRGAAAFPNAIIHPIDVQECPGAALVEPRGAVRWPLAAYQRLVDLHRTHPLEYAEFPDFGGEAYFALQARRLIPGTAEALANCLIGVRLHMPAILIDATNQRTWLGRQRMYVAEMERAVLASADVLWSPCHAVVHALQNLGLDLDDRPARRVVVSPNPFVPTIAQPESGGAQDSIHPPPESSTSPPPHSEQIVFVGRLERRKGPAVLVQAAVALLRQRPGLRVRLLGGDTDTAPLDASVIDWLESMIPHDLTSRLVLEGSRPREECVRAIRSTPDLPTVVCFPALWDNWPYAVLEAMAAGAAIVASDSGGHAEMLQHESTALLVPAGDAAALAHALRRLLDDPPLRSTLGAAARRAAHIAGDPARFAHQTIDLVDHLRRQPSASSAPTNAIKIGPSRPATAQPHEHAHLAPRDVTIVIPHKDMAHYLPETLECLAHQSVRGFHVVLVDDGSTHERALAVLDRAQSAGLAAFATSHATSNPTNADHGPLRIIRQPCAGPAAARNTGIAAATTPLIVTLDADDILRPTFIQRALDALNARQDLACVGALVSYFDEHPDRPTGAWAPLGLIRDMLPAINTMGTGSGIMFRRHALLTPRTTPAPHSLSNTAGPFDPTVPGYEDWDLYCALAAAGHRGDILPEFLVSYRVRADSRYHAKDRLRHERLVSELAARHPTLALNPDRAMRLLVGEARARQLPERRRLRRVRRERDALRKQVRRLKDRLETARKQLARAHARSQRQLAAAQSTLHEAPPAAPLVALPWRYRAADRAAGVARRFGLSAAARRFLGTLRRGS